MATIGSLIVDLKAETAAFRNDLAKAQAAMNTTTARMKKSADGMERAFNGLRGAVMGVQAAIAGLVGAAIVQFGVDTVKAFAEAEAAANKLNAVLKATGRFSVQLSRDLVKGAEGLQAITTFDDDAIVRATATLGEFSEKLNGDDLKQGQQAIVALATRLGVDLDKAAMMVGKTVETSTNALARYGIEVDKNATASEKLAQINAQLASSFEVAKAKTNTTEGAFKQLQVQWENTLEKIGEIISKNAGLQNSFKSLTDILIKVNNFLSQHEKEISTAITATINFGVSIGKLVGGIVNLLDKIGLLKLAWQTYLDVVKLNKTVFETTSNLVNGLARAFGWLADKITAATNALGNFFNKQKERAKGGFEIRKEFFGFQKASNEGGDFQLAGNFITDFGAAVPATNEMMEQLRNSVNATGQSFVTLKATATDSFGTIRGFAESTASKIGDTLMKAAETGKFEFKEMVASILKDLAQLIMQKSVIGPLSNIFTGIFSGLFRADGGSVSGGKPYIVGERGPEMFVPGASGTIVPNHRLGGDGGGQTVIHQHITVHAIDTRDFRDRLAQEAPMIGRLAVKANQEAYNRRGTPGPLDGRRR